MGGKHAGGNGDTMKKGGSWNGRNKSGEQEDKTKTERFGKQKG